MTIEIHKTSAAPLTFYVVCRRTTMRYGYARGLQDAIALAKRAFEDNIDPRNTHFDVRMDGDAEANRDVYATVSA